MTAREFLTNALDHSHVMAIGAVLEVLLPRFADMPLRERRLGRAPDAKVPAEVRLQ